MFRGLPSWGQGVLWVVLAPLLLAVLLVRGRQPSRSRYLGAVGAILLLGPVWIAALSGPLADVSGPGETAAPDTTAAPDVATDPAADEPGPREPASEPRPAPVPDIEGSAPESGWKVINVVDGDTIDVRHADGTEERVRIVGIDTPERGECAFGEASIALADLVIGEQVTLVAGARDDRDRYDRILRYVDVGNTDAGLELIELGLAVARYDSRDGYGEHPREAAYVAADAAMVNITCD